MGLPSVFTLGIPSYLATTDDLTDQITLIITQCLRPTIGITSILLLVTECDHLVSVTPGTFPIPWNRIDISTSTSVALATINQERSDMTVLLSAAQVLKHWWMSVFLVILGQSEVGRSQPHVINLLQHILPPGIFGFLHWYSFSKKFLSSQFDLARITWDHI